MPGYPHLTRSERDQIADLKAQGFGVTAIAEAIGRHKSTISRELRRNAHADGTYRPVFAEGSYLYRRQRAAVLERDDRLRRFVIDRLAPLGRFGLAKSPARQWKAGHRNRSPAGCGAGLRSA